MLVQYVLVCLLYLPPPPPGVCTCVGQLPYPCLVTRSNDRYRSKLQVKMRPIERKQGGRRVSCYIIPGAWFDKMQ